MGTSVPAGPLARRMTPDKPFMASMGIYVFSRDVLHEVLARDQAVDFGREIIPHALSTHRVHAHFYRGFWADVGTVSSFYDVNLMLTQHGAPFNFFHPTRPIYTRPRFLPATQVHKSEIDETLISEGCYVDDGCTITNSVVGIRTAVRTNARISRSVLLGADFYEESFGEIPMGIGRNAVLDRVIVDKNARIGDNVQIGRAHV